MVDTIGEADERAQEAFHRMLAIYTDLGEWEQASVDAYHNAERDLDWEREKAELDALIDADRAERPRLMALGVYEGMDDYCEPEKRLAWGDR